VKSGADAVLDEEDGEEEDDDEEILSVRSHRRSVSLELNLLLRCLMCI